MEADATCLRPAARGEGGCGFAFLDPPYDEDAAAPALTALAGGDWLSSNAVVVVELERKTDFEAPANFVVLDDRTYGAARIVILRYAPGDD